MGKHFINRTGHVYTGQLLNRTNQPVISPFFTLRVKEKNANLVKDFTERQDFNLT